MTNSDSPTTHAEQTSGLSHASKEALLRDPSTQSCETLSDGTRVSIRPLRKEDGPLERAFIEHLSPLSREYRFLGQMKVSDDLIRRMTDLDYERDMAFVALRDDAGDATEIGVARFCVAKDGESCECAVTVSDEWQHKGVGTLLMRRLIDVARQRGIKRMISIDMAGNMAMRSLAESLGFDRTIKDDYPSEVMHTLVL